MKKIQIVGAFMAALVLSVFAVPGASAEFDFEGVQSGKDLCSDGGWGTITGKGITETGFLTETYSVS